VIYLQAIGLFALALLVISILFGGGMMIVAIGAAIGAGTFVVFVVATLVMGVWDWLANYWPSKRPKPRP
jgi:O-antigen/teichoic acid export membrane protein